MKPDSAVTARKAILSLTFAQRSSGHALIFDVVEALQVGIEIPTKHRERLRDALSVFVADERIKTQVALKRFAKKIGLISTQGRSPNDDYFEHYRRVAIVADVITIEAKLVEGGMSPKSARAKATREKSKSEHKSVKHIQVLIRELENEARSELRTLRSQLKKYQAIESQVAKLMQAAQPQSAEKRKKHKLLRGKSST